MTLKGPSRAQREKHQPCLNLAPLLDLGGFTYLSELPGALSTGPLLLHVVMGPSPWAQAAGRTMRTTGCWDCPLRGISTNWINLGEFLLQHSAFGIPLTGASLSSVSETTFYSCNHRKYGMTIPEGMTMLHLLLMQSLLR